MFHFFRSFLHAVDLYWKERSKESIWADRVIEQTFSDLLGDLKRGDTSCVVATLPTPWFKPEPARQPLRESGQPTFPSPSSGQEGRPMLRSTRGGEPQNIVDARCCSILRGGQ